MRNVSLNNSPGNWGAISNNGDNEKEGKSVMWELYKKITDGEVFVRLGRQSPAHLRF